MNPDLTPNGLHRSDMTVIGDLQHGSQRFSVAHLTRSDAPRRVQWYIDGSYDSGPVSRAATALDQWLRRLPPGPRLFMNSQAIEVARSLRAGGAK